MASESDNRNPAQLRNDIEASREAITDTIKRLDEHVHRAVDWRAQVRDHPLVAVGAAAVGGMLLAGMFRRKPSPRDRIVDAIAESVEDITDKVRHRLGSQLTRTVTGSLLKAAVTTVVAKKATEYVLQMTANALNSNNSET
jgi:outer membrane murein-binding lipoprotein Lpp